MSTYRITIKYWDRHYGDGHTQFSRKFEARRSAKADQEAIDILENALKSHSNPQGRIAEAWAERSDRGYPGTLRAYNGASGSWVRVNPVRPAATTATETGRHSEPEPALIEEFAADVNALRQERGITFEEAYDEITKPDWVSRYQGNRIDLENQVINKAKSIGRARRRITRETGHIVADFNTLDDLIAHAQRELGATHVLVAGPDTRIYFRRGGQYPYEEARVWRKGGYWHAEGPGARSGVQQLPADAQPIGVSGGRRAAETGRRQVYEDATGESQWMVRYVHKISPSPKDVWGPITLLGGDFSNRNTLGAALRRTGTITRGARVANFRVEVDRIIVFPLLPGSTTYWHSIILTNADSNPNARESRRLNERPTRSAHNPISRKTR